MKAQRTADVALDQAGAEYDEELRGKTRRSIGWTISRAASDQIFSFIIFVLLAQLLSPAEIGIFAIAYLFAEAGRIIATSGLTQLIARAPKIEPRLVDTVFWTNIAVAIAYALLIAAAAPAIAGLIDQPEAQLPLQVLPIATVINALGATHLALRLREFGHKTIAIRSVLSGLIGGGAALIAALMGAGVWSLIIQRMVSETIGAVLSWAAYRWTPGTAVSLTQARENLGFGGNLTIAQLIFLFLVRVQDLLIAASLGAAAVGIYRVAWRTAEIIGNGAIQPFSSVGLQTYSRLQDNPPMLREAYRTMLRSCATLSFPALVGFGALAPDVVPMVFGEKWQEAGELAQIFAFMAIPYTLNYFASPVLGAMGDSARQRSLAVVQLVATLALTWLALPFGLVWVAIAYVARSYLTLPLQIHYLRASSSIRLADSWRAVRAPFLASTLMGGLLWSGLFAWHRVAPVGWTAVVILILAGAAVYAATLLLISPAHRSLLRGMLSARKIRHA